MYLPSKIDIKRTYCDHMRFSTGYYGWDIVENGNILTCQQLDVDNSDIPIIRHSIIMDAPSGHVFNMVNSLYYTRAIDEDVYDVGRVCTIDLDEERYDWCNVVKTKNKRSSFFFKRYKREYTKVDISSRQDMTIVTRSISEKLSSILRVIHIDNNTCQLVHSIWMDTGGSKSVDEKTKLLHKRGKGLILNASELVERSMGNGCVVPKGNPLDGKWEIDPYKKVPGLSYK